MIHSFGPGDKLVFQHGLCGGERQIREAMGPRTDWRALECPGHGGSTFAAPSIAGFAAHVVALIESLGHPVALGGISMGAAIATRIAVIRPDLVRALVLVRPAWVTDAAPPNMAPNAEVGRLIAAGEPVEAFDRSPTARRLARTAPDNLASLRGFFARPPLAETATLLQAISADGPGLSPDDLRALRLPTLVAGCAEDEIHPLSHVAALAALIPRARALTLPPKGRDKAAHLAAQQSTLTQFLKETEDAPRP